MPIKWLYFDEMALASDELWEIDDNSSCYYVDLAFLCKL